MATMQRQSRMPRLRLLGAGIALASLAALPAQAQEPIEIGNITSLTGTNAVQGTDIQRGIALAVQRINDGYEVPTVDGGSIELGPGLLDGRSVEVIAEDTESRPASAMDATRKLVNVDDVSVILGEYSSGVTLPTAQFSNENGVVQIGIGSTSPELAEVGPYYFNVIGTDVLMGEQLAEFAHEDSGVDEFTSITPNNPFGVGVERRACARLEELGGKCIQTSRYELEKSDYSPIIRATVRDEPKAGFFTAYGTEARLILRQMHEMGIDLERGWYADYPTMWAQEISEIAEVGEGIKGLRPGPPSDDEFLQEEYAAGYVELHGEEPTTAFGAYGYDAAMLVALAIEEAGSAEADAIREALPSVAEGYQGVTGDKAFDDIGMQVDETYRKVIYTNGELRPYDG